MLLKLILKISQTTIWGKTTFVVFFLPSLILSEAHTVFFPASVAVVSST